MHNSSCLALTAWTPAAESDYAADYDVVIPKAPRLPHDVDTLVAFYPTSTGTLDPIGRMAKRERTNWIADLIASALGRR